MRQGPLSFQSTVASVLLDSLRGAAALMVCLAHWSYLFFIDYPQVTAHRRLLYFPYIVCSAGHQAVVIFFVMSGYLVGGHVLRALRTSRWSWHNYLIQRGTRLWVVLVPALIMGGILDLIALHYNISPRLYHGKLTLSITYSVANALTWRVFLGNLFFLQTTLTPVFGSNTPLWSLANEFWYYLMFPLGLLAIWGACYTWLQRLGMGLLCIAMLKFVSIGIAKAFPIWLMGVLLTFIPIQKTAPWLRWMAAILYFALVLIISRGVIPDRFHPDYCLAFATVAMLWTLLGAEQPAGNQWYVAPSRVMAGFAYTLYLVHAPLMVILTGLHHNEVRWTPDLPHIAEGMGIFVFVVGVSYVVALFTEFRTTQIRDRLLKMF